jgi:hypothetical protein
MYWKILAIIPPAFLLFAAEVLARPTAVDP